jgi:hypothetical protein
LIVVVVLLLAASWSWVRFAHAPLGKAFAQETYDAATTADDAGDEPKAKKLFVEACQEGSVLACQAVGMRR